MKTIILIEIRESEKIPSTSISNISAFVYTGYNLEVINYIRSMRTRVYLPDCKMWELPITSLATLINNTPTEQVKIAVSTNFITSTDIQLPKNFSFKTQPYSHQYEGVLFGLKNKNFLLGDDQGLGKSMQAINIALARRETDGIKRCLILCGVNGTKYNWEQEVKIHSNEKAWILGTRYRKTKPYTAFEGSSNDKLDDLNNLPNDFFIITNVETLRAKAHKKGNKFIFPIADKINQLCENGEIGMIVFDESHKLKNPGSQQGKALLKITADVPKISMSGTFIINNPLDLYVPLKWGGFESHSYYLYKKHFCMFGGFNNQEVIGYKNLSDLKQTIDKVVLRRTKDEVLDLPPKVHTVEYVEMGSSQQKLYNEVMKNIKDNIDKIRLHPSPLTQIIRLRQVTGFPEILSSSITQSAKFERLKEILEVRELYGQKTILYSQWESITQILKNELQKYNPAYITGATPTEQRMQEVNRFQNDENCTLIIGTIGAMGTGLTLNKADAVIFMDEPWSRAIKDQAEDRAHRIGTQGTVSVITLICKNTIDEKISAIVQRKGRISDILIDGKFDTQNSAEVLDFLLS